MSADLVIDTLLEASLRASVIAGLIAAVLAGFRVKAAATKHAAWTTVMVAMLSLPLVSRWIPSIPLPVTLPVFSSVAPPAVADAAADPPTAQPVAASGSYLQRMAQLPPVHPPGPFEAVGSPAIPSRAPQTRNWRQSAVFVWLTVAALLLLREFAGWWRVRQLSADAVPSSAGDGTFQSNRVATPVVTGLVRTRVMVPPTWDRWGASVRHMVLAHERAHIARYDPLIAALARVNRAVFWFHPLAWWMERHLSRLAESACDDIVVRKVNDSRLYAALLVEMAHRLRQHGHRVAWQGIGIVSPSRFEDRVDQILQGPSPDLSRRSKAALATACGLLLIAGIACGTTSAAPLAEDPEVAKGIADRAARFADYEAAMKVTLDDVPGLEKAVASNPDDLSSTSRLLTFYMSRGTKLMGWNEMVAARRPHLLRLIERHPESSLVNWPLSRRLDPEGYDRARALWLAHVERPDVTPAVLSHAATFFERSEKPMAERLLLQGQAADPKGPTPRISADNNYRLSWSRRLGTLYAMTMAGSDQLTSWDEVTSASSDQIRSDFAAEARRKLDESNDAALLLAAGSYLINRTAKVTLPFDAQALGKQYVEKASRLDPASEEAKRILALPAHNLQYERMVQTIGPPGALDEAAFEKLPLADRLEYASRFLWSPYSQMMRAFQLKMGDDVEASFERLKARAGIVQKLIDNTEASAVPAGLQADTHIAFGTYAMHQGDRREAVRRLELFASTASEESLAGVLGLSPATAKLAHDLLDAGERESVAKVYDNVAKLASGAVKTKYESAAKAVREGRMPVEYQRSKARIW
jgi:hypothetical protein